MARFALPLVLQGAAQVPREVPLFHPTVLREGIDPRKRGAV